MAISCRFAKLIRGYMLRLIGTGNFLLSVQFILVTR